MTEAKFEIQMNVPMPESQRGQGYYQAIEALKTSPIGASVGFPLNANGKPVNPDVIRGIAGAIMGKGAYATRKTDDEIRVWRRA